MRDTLQRRIVLLILGSSLTALAAAYLVWLWVPVSPKAWAAVIWFALFATLAELAGVNTDDEKSIDVTPSSPIYWASVCVLGPIPSIAVVVVSALLSDVLALLSHRAVKLLSLSPGQDAEDGLESTTRTRTGDIRDVLSRVLSRTGAMWEMRSADFGTAFRESCLYVSGLVLLVAPAGLVYSKLGGHFLVDAPADLEVLRQFILPFIALVCVAIAAEHLAHMVVMAVIDPIAGARGIYGAFLRMRLVLIEHTKPLIRAQLFLVVVALLLSYLYRFIGPWGFILTALPIWALRDFFYQWVQEHSAYIGTITTLAACMQHYHPYTRGHLKRVADISVRLARELRLPAESIKYIGQAGMLHDIGKIGVSEEILDKVGKLTDEEWGQIKAHPVKGADIISHIEFLEGIVDWIKYHHKWYNGQGYPDTNGDGVSIPVEARIIAVADSFDAMTDDRELCVEWTCDSCGYKPGNGERPSVCPNCGAEKRRLYREPKTLDQAIDELRRGCGSQFDPNVVKAFLKMVERDGIHLNA